MYYANVKKLDISNWPWLRVSLFVSWCLHECPWCFNAEAWNFKYWKEYTEEVTEKIIKELKNNFYRWFTVLWWEPLAPQNQEEVSKIIKRVKKETNKEIWLYSWFTFDIIMKYMYNNERFPFMKDIIDNIDVLVDWRFILRLKDLSLQFRWSSNQRILDIKKSLLKKKPIWLDWVIDKQKYTKKSF